MSRILHVAAALLVALAAPATAELQRYPASAKVGDVMDAAVDEATDLGATIFARIDHAEGAASVGEELRPAQLLIFGNPAVGTPAMQDDPQAGLQLPLRLLVYEDAEGQTWVVHQSVEDIFQGLSVDPGADYAQKIAGALRTVAEAAAGRSY